VTGMDAHSFSYVECDVPEGMTLHDWRRRGGAPSAHPRLLVWLRRLF
jgi:hypothetical protein